MTNTMKRLAVLLIGTLFILCVAIVLAISLPVSTAFAAEGEPEATVHDHNDGTWTELTATGGTLQSGNYYLTSDVTLTTDITIADNATVVLCLNGYKLTGARTNAVITFNEGVDFTLEDCSADASAPAGRGVITGGIGFLDEYSARHGGGVYISGNSTFTMNGGTISGNTATFGGGVGVDNDGTFTMNGGTISGNTANFDGGGVELVNGTFTMTGGTISGNSAYDWGGGVYVRNNSTFTMEGGTITDNTAKTFGGGVYVAYGTFTMSGGTISNNSAVYNDDGGNGGGVGVDNYGTFTMNGGTISGNTATVGGGVGVDNYGTFTMNGGTISDNTANYGGGVYARYGTFTLKGGTISDNVATRNGGGVDVESGTFTMTGGTISDNMATYFGSCVYKNGGTVSISGGYLDGTIDGSTVSISGGYFSEAPDAAHLAEGRGAYDISALGGVLFDFDYIEGYPYAVYVKGVISISTEDIVYDGSPVAEGVDFTVEGADGVTLTYSYKAEGGDEFTAGLPTNAGDYTLSAYALNEEKQFISVLFDITIAKATYDMSGITFADGNFTYDREAHSIAISGTLPSGVTVTYDGNGKVNVGEYTVTAKFAVSDANYNEIDDMTAKLTITKATYDMSGIKFENDSVLYNGEEQSLAISGTLPAGVTVTYEGNGKIAAGTYMVTAKFAVGNDNYNAIPDMKATLTIEKGVPQYTAPTELTVSVGQNVADITLPSGWAWKDGDVQFGTAGEHKAIAVYTAADTANYAPVEVELTVTVSESEPTEPDQPTDPDEPTDPDQPTDPEQPGGEITSEEPEGLSGGAIAGIVIGCILGVLLIEYGVFALLYKKKLISGAFFGKIYPFIKD